MKSTKDRFNYFEMNKWIQHSQKEEPTVIEDEKDEKVESKVKDYWIKKTRVVGFLLSPKMMKGFDDLIWTKIIMFVDIKTIFCLMRTNKEFNRKSSTEELWEELSDRDCRLKGEKKLTSHKPFKSWKSFYQNNFSEI